MNKYSWGNIRIGFCIDINIVNNNGDDVNYKKYKMILFMLDSIKINLKSKHKFNTYYQLNTI